MTFSSRESCQPDSLLSACASDPPWFRCAHGVPIILLILLLTIIYANSFKGTWMFDDGSNIVENPHVHLKDLDWESIKGTFHGMKDTGISRPLSYLSFGLNYLVHGLDVWGYHLVNLIIHCLAAVFLYLFIFQTLNLPLLKDRYADRAGTIALLAAALWATSPIQVTAVTYIVQRMASMSAMFFIMAMYFYLMGRISPLKGPKTGWFLLCALSGLFSIASKENAVMLPAVLYGFDLLLIQGLTRQRMKRHMAFGAVLLLFLTAMFFILSSPSTLLAGYANREFTLMERLLTQPRILVYYLSLMLYPMTDRFTLIYEVQVSTSLLTPWTTLPAIFFWMAWTGAGLYWAERRPLISFCLLFFIVNHLIESSFIPLELIYEHRNYLPSMTLFIPASIGIIAFLHHFSKNRLLQFLVLVFVWITLAGQGHTVYLRNALFEHPLYMWLDNAEKSPGLSRVHNNLARTYDEMGMPEEARYAYLNAIKANRYPRRSSRGLTFLNLADNYLNAGDPAAALKLYQQARSVDSGQWMVWHGVAAAMVHQEDLARAQSLLDFALKQDPDKAPLHSLYSLVLLKLGVVDHAIQEAKAALAYEPDSPLALKVLGEAHNRLKKYEPAHRYWKQYALSHPQDLEALLAILQLAHQLGDEKEFRQTAVHILDIRQDRTWNECFEELKNRQGQDFLVFMADPRQALPLIRQAVEMEIHEIQ